MTAELGGHPITLGWSGPYPLLNVVADPGPPGAGAAGVYVWVVRVAGEWWAHYVGETGTTFAQRTYEHLQLYREGQYRFYEPGLFAEGRKVIVWKGALGPPNRWRLPEFRRRLPEIGPILAEFVSLLSVFLIPVPGDVRVRERLEAAISRLAKMGPGGAGGFQDSDIDYHPCRPGEGPLTFVLPQPLPVAGLADLREIHLPLPNGAEQQGLLAGG